MADHRRQRSPENAHSEIRDEQHVQHRIQNSRDGDEQERPSGIPHSSQDRAHDVVSVNEHQPRRAGRDIAERVRIGFRRRVQNVEYPSAEHDAQHGYNRSNHKQKSKDGPDHFPDVVFPLFPDQAGDQDLTGVGKANGQKCEKMKHFPADGDSAHSRPAEHLPGNNHVHDIVNGLKGVGKKQGHRKRKQELRNAPLRQVPYHTGVLSLRRRHLLTFKLYQIPPYEPKTKKSRYGNVPGWNYMTCPNGCYSWYWMNAFRKSAAFVLEQNRISPVFR